MTPVVKNAWTERISFLSIYEAHGVEDERHKNFTRRVQNAYKVFSTAVERKRLMKFRSSVFELSSLSLARERERDGSDTSNARRVLSRHAAATHFSKMFSCPSGRISTVICTVRDLFTANLVCVCVYV